MVGLQLFPNEHQLKFSYYQSILVNEVSKHIFDDVYIFMLKLYCLDSCIQPFAVCYHNLSYYTTTMWGFLLHILIFSQTILFHDMGSVTNLSFWNPCWLNLIFTISHNGIPFFVFFFAKCRLTTRFWSQLFPYFKGYLDCLKYSFSFLHSFFSIIFSGY